MSRWFSELKVAHKLMLMSIFFLLPDSIMLSMMLLDINSNISFAQQEIRGNAYLRPLVHLLKLLPEHQRLRESGATDAIIATTARQIDKQLAELADADRRYGRDLQFTDAALSQRGRVQARAEFLNADWTQIQADHADLAVTAALYRHPLACVHTMITHAGDMSNLILDPDLDSYYLVDAVLLSLPQSQDELSRALDDGRVLLASSNPQAAAPLAALHAQILRDLAMDHVANSINTAVREHSGDDARSASFRKQMPPALDQYLPAVNHFIELTQRLGQATGAAVSEDEYEQAANSAKSADLALWEVASDQLDLLLQIRIDGLQAHRRNAICVTAFAVVSATLLITFINRSINRPLKRHAEALKKANDALSIEVQQRMAAQAELVEASRQAGMAEIAVGVLHNVGNVLNSVNTSATVIREKLDRNKVPLLAKTAELIQNHRADSTNYFLGDPQGKNVPDLLVRLCDVMANDAIEITGELTLLDRNLDHIKHIVQAQQSFAKGSPLLQAVSLAEVIEDAIRITAISSNATGIEVVQNLEPCPPVMLDKHTVMQILVNLIGNARKAVVASPVSPKRVEIALEVVRARERDRLRIIVTDNGVGISPAQLGRIFQHGFTTWKDGHGFGLHSAAIEAHQMGGAITVASPGPGKGAQFTFEIPVTLNQFSDGAAV